MTNTFFTSDTHFSHKMTALQHYYRLMYEAHSASVEVDMFDVDSSNEISKQKFLELCEESRRAQIELIEFLSEYGNTVIQTFTSSSEEGITPIPEKE